MDSKDHTDVRAPATSAVDLYWIPLGAGAHIVRWNGKVYEAIKALIERRPRYDLYHSAVEVSVPDGRFVIEVTPIPDERGPERGVVAEGPVGTGWAGRFRLFRYEIRRWRDGSIPDVNEAVSSPVRVANHPARARRILDLVPSVPNPVWGRDDLGTGDMWNSNSVISWLLVHAGVDTDPIRPPSGGRAPGWDAGLVVSRRETRPGPGRPSTPLLPPVANKALPGPEGPCGRGTGDPPDPAASSLGCHPRGDASCEPSRSSG